MLAFLRQTFFLTVLAGISNMAAASAVCLDRDSGQPTDLTSIANKLRDLDHGPLTKAASLSVDINYDGANELIVKSNDGTCGTGGCFFSVFDGKTGRNLGEQFGGMLYFHEPLINGWPVLEVYGHSSAESGTFATWVMEGGRYLAVADVFLQGALLKQHVDKLQSMCSIP